MNIYNDKSALPSSYRYCASPVFIENLLADTTKSTITKDGYYTKGRTRYHSVREPSAEYTSTAQQLNTLRNQLEQHFDRYHFHQLSLLALSSHDDYKDDDHWYMGAYLAGRSLNQLSEHLAEQLSQICLAKA